MPKPIHCLRLLLLPLGLAAAVQPLAAQNDLNVPGGTVTVNDSASFQNVTVGVGATLTTVDSNSGGAGDHAITVTFAAGGPGTIQNDGLIDLLGNDQGNTTVFANPVTLSGSGTLSLRNGTRFNTSHVQGPGTVTQAAGHTLLGAGGGDTGPSFSAPLVNAGLVTTSSQGLHLDGASLRNTGTFSASGGATLTLGATTLDNTGGLVAAADATSFVNLAGTTIIGGTLSSINGTGSDIGGGAFYNTAPVTLQNVTLAAGSVFNVANPLTVAGTFTNNGYATVGGFNFNTEVYSNLNVAADATLAGSGIARLAGGRVEATNNATLTVAAGATLVGGSGVVDASIVNNGTVGSAYQNLDINSPVFTNNGTLSAVNNASVNVSGSTNLTNFDAGSGTLGGGTYAVADTGNGASLNFNGRSVKINAATVTLSGGNANFDALNALSTNAGTLALLNLKQLNTSVALTNTGTINLDAGTTLHVGGDFTSVTSSKLAVTLGGTQSSGAGSPGVLQADSTATVGGTLTLSFAAGAALPANTDTLTIVSAGSPVQGSFGNVPSGARLATTDGKGSFRVSYGAAASAVILSDFLLPGQMDALPTATLSAVVPSVAADSGQEGEFMLTLSSAPSTDVVINFTIKGTAVNGTDYLLLKMTKKIKAGKTSKPIKITPLGEGAGPGGKRTVVLTLQPGEGYQVGTTGKVKVKIIGQ